MLLQHDPGSGRGGIDTVMTCTDKGRLRVCILAQAAPACYEPTDRWSQQHACTCWTLRAELDAHSSTSPVQHHQRQVVPVVPVLLTAS